MIKIESKNNAFFRKLKKLKEKKFREKEQLFLAEGRKILEYTDNVAYYVIDEENEDQYSNCGFYDLNTCIVLKTNLFKEVSSQENSQGIISICRYNDFSKQVMANDIIVLDKVQDPGNLGTIIRTGEAAGINNFIMIKGTVDIYNEKVIRSTMGSIFEINYIYMDEMEAVTYLKNSNYNIISSTLNEKSIDYRKMNLKIKNALVFGNEGKGISKIIEEYSNEFIKIPILGKAESLNVAIAAGVIIYKYQELKNI